MSTHPTIITLASSPNLRSRSTALLAHGEQQLRNAGFTVQRFGLKDFPAEDLLGARREGDAANRFNGALATAVGVVIAGPVYKGTYNAVLKGILDLVARKGFAGKRVLTLATGGDPKHHLALEQALSPLLAALDAQGVVAGTFAYDEELPWSESEPELALPETIKHRVGQVISQFQSQLHAAATAEATLSA